MKRWCIALAALAPLVAQAHETGYWHILHTADHYEQEWANSPAGRTYQQQREQDYYRERERIRQEARSSVRYPEYERDHRRCVSGGDNNRGCKTISK